VLVLPDGALQPAAVVKNLGVYLDEILSMDDNARHCTRTCFFHMRRIRQLGRFIDYETKYTLVRALILSRLDYCNSLYAGCSAVTLHVCRLQRVQNAAIYQAVVWCITAYPCSSSFEAATLATRRQSYSVQTVLFDVRHLYHCTGIHVRTVSPALTVDFALLLKVNSWFPEHDYFLQGDHSQSLDPSLERSESLSH